MEQKNKVQYTIATELWPGSSVHRGCSVCKLDFGAVGNFIEQSYFLERCNLIAHLIEMHGLSVLEALLDYREAVKLILERRNDSE